MSSKAPKKRNKNGDRNTSLRDSCYRVLSNFADDGATVDMLKKAIRDDSDHTLEDENTPTGGEALEALLKNDPKVEKVRLIIANVLCLLNLRFFIE